MEEMAGVAGILNQGDLPWNMLGVKESLPQKGLKICAKTKPLKKN
jgi:hypothetical protein